MFHECCFRCQQLKNKNRKSIIIILCDVSDSVLFQWVLWRFTCIYSVLFQWVLWRFTCIFMLLAVINVYITFLNRLPLIYFQLNVENVGEFCTVCVEQRTGYTEVAYYYYYLQASETCYCRYMFTIIVNLTTSL